MSSSLCQQSQAHRLYSLYLHYDAKHQAKHDDPECKAVLQHCFALFEKDYVVGVVANHQGQLCASYPSELAILEKPRHPASTEQQQQQCEQRSKADQTPMSCHSAPPTHIPIFHSASAVLRSASPPCASNGCSSVLSQAVHGMNSTSYSNPITNGGDHGRVSSHINNNNIIDSKAEDEMTNQSMAHSMFEDADQSFDMSESGMMSFQDIKTELDMIPTPQTLHHGQQEQEQPSGQMNDQDRSRRHILPFPFRIPRPEKNVNVAIKEYVAPPQAPHSNKETRVPTPSIVDKDKVNDAQELSKQFEKSHFARVRARFVVPCILVRGKNICRSATLSNEVEVIMHKVLDEFNQKRKMFFYGAGEKGPDKEDRESSLEKQRMEDIELLHRLGVTYINDLMVENRKVKYGLKVTSSEKVDSFGRYSKFRLVATPYPGVEFFQKFKANKYNARKLCFDWNQNFADAELQLPPGHSDSLGIRWRDYKSWDLIELTQNYLRLYLSHIADDTMDQDVLDAIKNSTGTPARAPKGLLIHCISGWDRTPLFISLLRISLWADGEAHQSLTAAEMLYLTMGYDWFLFNHLLADRSQRGEDIFYFCFYFLKFIYDEEFSLKSVSNLVKKGKKGATRTDTQQFFSQSPLSKDIDRLRGKNDTSIGRTDTDDHNQDSICDECKLLKKSPNEPIGRDIKSVRNGNGNHEVASSTDGKPSSWQFISSFSTPPGRERHGSSPRGPFTPTLQNASRAAATGSPLGVKRNSYTANFDEDNKGSSLDQEVLLEPPTATSPLKLTEGRFRLGLQQLNARRSSSSGIPSLITEAKRAAQRASAMDSSRMATSPEALNSREMEDFEDMGDSTAGDLIMEKQSTPRKRASTFDGGLLANGIQEGHEHADGLNPKEQEEDSTSGDDDNGDEDHGGEDGSGFISQHSQQRNVQPRVCHICHNTFFSGTDQPDRRSTHPTGNGSFTASRNPIPVHTDTLNRSYQQPPGFNSKQTLERNGDIDSIFPQNGFRDDMEQLNYRRRSTTQATQDCDREEGMFQLEIEDRTHYPCNEMTLGRGLGSQPCRLGSRRQDGALGNGHSCNNGACDVRDRCPAEDELGNAEGDESFWDETSTIDYGYSPGSILNDNQRPGRRLEDSVQVVEDEEEDDDDGAASLNSRRSSIKLDHHDSDNMFMPSLKGVFSAADRTMQGRGKGRGLSMDNTDLVEDPSHSLGSEAQDGSNVNPGSLEEAGTSHRKVAAATPKKLTRRQKLRQLRRLFMGIRNEMGGGGGDAGDTHPSASSSTGRPVDQRNHTSGSFNSATEGDDDSISSSSFKAESFSDDSSFQYRSPTSQSTGSFANRRGSNTALGLPPLMRGHEHEFELGFARGSSSSRYPDESFSASPVKSQHRQSHGTPSSNGRKSPFEWAVAAAFGHTSNASSTEARHRSSIEQPNLQQPRYNSPSGSNHYSRPYSFSSSPRQYQQQQQQQCSGSDAHHDMQRPLSGSLAQMRGFQDPTTTSTMLGWAGERWSSSTSGTTATGTNTSASSGSRQRADPNHDKDKGSENSGQKGW